MGYERYPRNAGQGDRNGQQDYAREHTYSSARDYAAAGSYRDGDRERGRDRRDDDRYGQRVEGHYGRNYGAPRPRGEEEYHGSYASDGRRFEDVGNRRDRDDDNRREARRGYGAQPQGYDDEDRGFFARAGDEVRSWFGDEQAERRRDYDERGQGAGHEARDDHYGNWRRSQISALDRDYDEYRREHRSKFENEFSTWRSNRQTQRDALNKVEEHMDVVGSDGTHVGTVDKVRGDRILLTRNDADAGGRHHSIPSSWLQTVDTKVTLSKTAEEAKRQWRDEERNQAMFGDADRGTGRDDDKKMLNRSFPGTY